MTLLTKEQIEALLDGATPGPWNSDDVAVRLEDKSLVALVYGNGRGSFMANNRLIAAAPDLARTAIDALARLEDAEAAQALALERAVENKEQLDIWAQEILEGLSLADVLKIASYEDKIEAHDMVGRGLVEVIRSLADPSGVEALAALRAERDDLKHKLISPDPHEDAAHFDDHSVNRFSAVMKGKLASKRLQGRGGWQEPEVPNGYLSRLLREHVDKGDPVDVANFAMMIHQRGERIAPENEGASCKAIDKAEAERDAALARLAAAEAQP